MRNCICFNHQTIVLPAVDQNLEFNENERRRLRIIIFANKTKIDPKLKLESNSLYMKRNYTYEDLVEMHLRAKIYSVIL